MTRMVLLTMLVGCAGDGEAPTRTATSTSEPTGPRASAEPVAETVPTVLSQDDGLVHPDLVPEDLSALAARAEAHRDGMFLWLVTNADVIVVATPLTFEVVPGTDVTRGRCDTQASISAVVKAQASATLVVGSTVAYSSDCATGLPPPMQKAVIGLRIEPTGAPAAPSGYRVVGGFAVVSVGGVEMLATPGPAVALADYIAAGGQP